jgi:hypothetical protein
LLNPKSPIIKPTAFRFGHSTGRIQVYADLFFFIGFLGLEFWPSKRRGTLLEEGALLTAMRPALAQPACATPPLTIVTPILHIKRAYRLQSIFNLTLNQIITDSYHLCLGGINGHQSVATGR